MSSEINIDNIKSFFQGYMRHYIYKVVPMSQHIKEQYYYRLYNCKDTCLKEGRCKECNCPVRERAYSEKSCNPTLHPDLMSGSKWNRYKKENNIINIEEIINKVENELNK